VDDFGNGHWAIEEVFAGLKLMSIPAVENVSERRKTIRNDFFFLEQSNKGARAETVRNLDKTTLSRVSNNTPRSARVEHQSRDSDDANEKQKDESFSPHIR